MKGVGALIIPRASTVRAHEQTHTLLTAPAAHPFSCVAQLERLATVYLTLQTSGRCPPSTLELEKIFTWFRTKNDSLDNKFE